MDLVDSHHNKYTDAFSRPRPSFPYLFRVPISDIAFLEYIVDGHEIFIPQKVALRLKKNISEEGIEDAQRVFPIGYVAARLVVKKAGRLVGIKLRPHDLRRHAATHVSRSGTPIEIVSKIILRHTNLSTTHRYLGKVNDVEALRWIEKLYGKQTEKRVGPPRAPPFIHDIIRISQRFGLWFSQDEKQKSRALTALIRPPCIDLTENLSSKKRRKL